MPILTYSQGKLLANAAMMGGAALLFVLLFADPAKTEYLRGAGMTLHGSLGHFVVLPVLIIACLLACVGTLATSSGDLVALRAEGSDLVARTMWRRKRIAIADIRDVSIERTRISWFVHVDRLRLRAQGCTIRLSLGLTTTPWPPFDRLLATIEQVRKGASAAAPAVPGDVVAPGSDFDADAALARYLARKAEAAEAAPPNLAAGAAPPPPPRPSFGKKGLA